MRDAEIKLPVVEVPRPRCPACASVNIYCRSSRGEQGDGSVMRYAACRDCKVRFVLWLV